MGWIGLRDYQREAVDKMKTGCILCGIVRRKGMSILLIG